MLPLCSAPQECVHTRAFLYVPCVLAAMHTTHSHADTLPWEEPQVGIVTGLVPWDSGGEEASGIWVSPVIELSSHVPPVWYPKTEALLQCLPSCQPMRHPQPHTTPHQDLRSPGGACPRSPAQGHMEKAWRQDRKKPSGRGPATWLGPGAALGGMRSQGQDVTLFMCHTDW